MSNKLGVTNYEIQLHCKRFVEKPRILWNKVDCLAFGRSSSHGRTECGAPGAHLPQAQQLGGAKLRISSKKRIEMEYCATH